jgi:class 3 adenylate cyclase/tetratricopeptide (TPR) repeat protein
MLTACPSCGRRNPVGAKFCSECGAGLTALAAGPVTQDRDAVQPEGRPAASGERRQLTIMFCDLVDSTTFASRLDPEDTREVIGASLRMVTDVVRRHGGYTARYVGDGALVYFGYPHAHEDDAERSIQAGLQIIEEASSLTLLGGLRPQFRVGIATGLVVVGDIVRAGATGERDVVGETPHLAARLQTLAEPGSVVISQSTRQLAGRLFSYRDLGGVALKGFAEPVQAYRVLGTTGAESRFEALREKEDSPLIGRDAEFSTLRGHWQEACEGRGRVVLISGEPGIGKSRLTAMLSEQIADQPHTRLRYYCSRHQQASPFQPVINQLERAARIDRGDTPSRKLEKLTRLLGPEARDGDVFLVADLLSIQYEHRDSRPDLTPRRLREKTMDALLHQAELLASRRPVLMVFEDVHWIDPSSLDLLGLTIQRIGSLPVLLIVTFRPEFTPPWPEAHVVPLPLSPLSRDDSAALVRASAGESRLPSTVVDEIIERSDGIPLFVEELTRTTVDRLDRSSGTAEGKGAGESATVPTTLQASLMSRLDRLGDAREIALIGAAIGREFSYELVSGLARRPAPAVREALEQLTDSGLVQRRGVPPGATYQFRHALIHEAAYRSMLRSRRRALHAEIAAVFETDFPETAELQPELVAHHYEEAGLTEKATGYWLKAGHSALARSAIVEAIGRLRKGLDLVSTLPEEERRYRLELDFCLYLAQALVANTGYTSKATFEVVERARRACDKLGQPPQLAAVLSGQWGYALISNKLQTASQLSAELLDLGRARDDRIWTFLGYRSSGVTDFGRGRFVEARTNLEQARRIYKPADQAAYAALGVQDARVVVTTYLSWVLIYLGYFDQGRRMRDRAVDEARDLNQAYSMAHALNGLAFTELMLGEPQKALSALDDLERLNEEHGLAYYRPFVLIFRGLALADLGEAADGIKLIEGGIAAYRSAGAHLYTTTFYRWLASAHRRAGSYREGLKQLDEATRIAVASEAYGDEGEIHRVRAELLLALDDREGAERSYRAALDAARRRQAKQWELRAATGLARLLADRGDAPEARSLLGDVYGWFTEGFDTPDLKAARELLDELA